MTNKSSSPIIKFDYASEFTLGEIKKVSGLMKGRNLIQIIDCLDLEANPRNSKTGAVTQAIQDSIPYPVLFPFKTKGLLLASSDYELLERNRIQLKPQNLEVEGILDGGHNTLAIGLYILKLALDRKEIVLKSGQKTWEDFKELWTSYRDVIEEYLEYLRSEPNEGSLNFYIPVEILLPRDPEDQACVDFFNNALLEICEARNNNAELRIEAKANQRGYFDVLKEKMERKNPSIARRIEWKTNDGGDIRVQDLVALAWIPLSLIGDVYDENGRLIEPVAPNKLYSAKGSCMTQFEKLMSSPQVTNETSADYRHELCNSEVASAFEVAADLPELYDYIFEKFPECYNAAGGLYGKITEVKKLNERMRIKKTKFTDREISTLSPEGYILPLVYGLKALMEQVTTPAGYKIIRWKTDPMEFLRANLKTIVAYYSEMFNLCDYDPQKIGKAVVNYNTAIREFKSCM